jgi:hypothetical protein
MTAKRKRANGSGSWLSALTKAVERKPLVLFRFSEDEWDALRGSRRGPDTFTIARSYALLRNVRVPTGCILIGREFGSGDAFDSGDQFASADEVMRFGLLQSMSSNTTLESRLKIAHAQPISPSSEVELLDLPTDNALRAVLRRQLRDKAPIAVLSPVLSAHLVEELAKRPENGSALRRVAASLDAPDRYSDNLSLQEDAVGLALKAFGLPGDEAAARLELPEGGDSTLSRVSIREDAVIEHDARVVPGFSLASSDLTGRAIFRKGAEVLEVITANKRPLEEVLGVDLIYLNAIKQNVVMVQYKMLEQKVRHGGATDWLYRPDGQLQKELARMQLFNQSHAPGPTEYRINPQVFYLRFVRRDATLGQSAIIMPVDHFHVLEDDPQCRGSKGAFRISYESLDGRYLRQEAFLDLVHSGYIGAYARSTGALAALIRATLKSDRAVVAAVQSALRTRP